MKQKNARLFNETARYLALWMSIEDGIRVADLKNPFKPFSADKR